MQGVGGKANVEVGVHHEYEGGEDSVPPGVMQVESWNSAAETEVSTNEANSPNSRRRRMA